MYLFLCLNQLSVNPTASSKDFIGHASHKTETNTNPNLSIALSVANRSVHIFD